MSAYGYRYARWLVSNYRVVLFCGWMVAALSLWLTARLELRADFANLLPPSRQSVQDLKAIKERVRVFATLFVVVEADDPALRERAARAMFERVSGPGSAVDQSLIAHVAYDDTVERQFIWKNRFLLVGLAELKEARDALKQAIEQAKIRANPLYVSLDDEEEQAGTAELEARIDSLRKRLDEAERQTNKAPGFVSRNKRYQLIVIRSTFTASEVERGTELLMPVEQAARAVMAELGPGVRVGLTGDIVTGVHEHHSILRGMVLAAAATVLICSLALLLYYRSAISVMALFWALTVGAIATFGVTELVIGHLNLATAFLAAIVVGNGINPGLILMARYFEELRAGARDERALGNALVGALPGTAAASLTAGVAYASLIVTDFRGFRHFGIIGGIGMLLCWVAAYTVLPAALASMRRRIVPHEAPGIGNFLGAMLPRRIGIVVVIGLVATALMGVLTWRYLASNPIEEDWRNLRSTSGESLMSRYWDELIKAEFDEDFNRNLSGRFVIALPSREEAGPLVERLRAVDRGKKSEEALFLTVNSLDDLVPRDQDQKLALLGEIRAMIDGELVSELDDEDKALIGRVRPPENLKPIVDEDVPPYLLSLFTETGGERGRIIHASSGLRFDTWNVRHLVAFSREVRALGLPEDALVGGQAFVFADMLGAMEDDGPTATVVAVVGSILAIWLVIGFRRHGMVTMLCAFSGTLGMIALAAWFDVKINFLDFIALPITVGIGIDYAVNIAARERQDGHLGPKHVLVTTGGAVFMCSFTTTVGYGSLLLSENAGIRSFGLAAILGEIACLIAAVILAPSLLALWRKRQQHPG